MKAAWVVSSCRQLTSVALRVGRAPMKLRHSSPWGRVCGQAASWSALPLVQFMGDATGWPSALPAVTAPAASAAVNNFAKVGADVVLVWLRWICMGTLTLESSWLIRKAQGPFRRSINLFWVNASFICGATVLFGHRKQKACRVGLTIEMWGTGCCTKVVKPSHRRGLGGRLQRTQGYSEKVCSLVPHGSTWARCGPGAVLPMNERMLPE
jgi:hypothetical protein